MWIFATDVLYVLYLSWTLQWHWDIASLVTCFIAVLTYVSTFKHSQYILSLHSPIYLTRLYSNHANSQIVARIRRHKHYSCFPLHAWHRNRSHTHGASKNLRIFSRLSRNGTASTRRPRHHSALRHIARHWAVPLERSIRPRVFSWSSRNGQASTRRFRHHTALRHMARHWVVPLERSKLHCLFKWSTRNGQASTRRPRNHSALLYILSSRSFGKKPSKSYNRDLRIKSTVTSKISAEQKKTFKNVAHLIFIETLISTLNEVYSDRIYHRTVIKSSTWIYQYLPILSEA